MGRPPLQASCGALVKGLPGTQGVGPPRPGRGSQAQQGPRGGGDRLCPRETSVLKEDAALGSCRSQKQSSCSNCCCVAGKTFLN